MTEIRAKDKLFLVVAVPLAVLAAYVGCWRNDVVRRTDELAARGARLVAIEDFEDWKRRAEHELRCAEEELEAERRLPMPAAKVRADAGASAAEREREVLAVFREAGLRVVDTALCEGGAGAEVLRATGVRPAPVCRSYRIDGRYPQVREALEAFARREMAVIVEKLDMEQSGRGRWKLEVCL